MSPQKFIGTVDGEKIKPLRGLEESLKVGKALLRGTAPAEATPASLNLGLGAPVAKDNVVQFPEPKTFSPVPDEELGGPAVIPRVGPESTSFPIRGCGCPGIPTGIAGTVMTGCAGVSIHHGTLAAAALGSRLKTAQQP